MIVAGPLGEFPFAAIRTLHLDVIDMAVFIVHIDVQTDAFAVVAVIYGFFAFWKCDLFDYCNKNREKAKRNSAIYKQKRNILSSYFVSVLGHQAIEKQPADENWQAAFL